MLGKPLSSNPKRKSLLRQGWQLTTWELSAGWTRWTGRPLSERSRTIRFTAGMPNFWRINSFISSLLWLFCVTSTSSIAFFLPTILRGLGFVAERAQLLSIGPYFCAMIVCNIAAYFSDRLNIRSPFLLSGVCVAIIGFIIMLSVPISIPGPSYFGTFLIMRFVPEHLDFTNFSSVYTIQSTILTWDNEQ